MRYKTNTTDSEPYANRRTNRVRNRSHPSRVRVLSALGIESVVSIVVYTRRADVCAHRMLSKFPTAPQRFRTGTDPKAATFASPMFRLVEAIAPPWPRSL